MHSYYSVKAQPFQDYWYSTMVAEVASIVNEQLLGHYLFERTEDPGLLALCQRLLTGGEPERRAYLDFLAAGRTRFPLELLRDAGVDLAEKGPMEAAIARFAELVERLEVLLSPSG